MLRSWKIRLGIVASALWLLYAFAETDGDGEGFLLGGLAPIVLGWGIAWIVAGWRAARRTVPIAPAVNLALTNREPSPGTED